ncbi:MAG: sialate O-acetylesterase [Akkermansiaceae bacterium]
MKALVFLLVAIVSPAIADEEGKHLFILSGQSNMAGMKPEVSFTPAVSKAFGKENIIVTKSAYSGASIRSWAKTNHEFPPPTRGRVPKVRGHFYYTLIKGVKASIKGEKLKTVTFVWMQGESDLNNTAYDVYLKELIWQIQTDIDYKDINIVIGRISDCGLDREKRLAGKKYIRKTQQEFAESHPRGAWVDTDDLNDKKQPDGTILHDLHYTPEGYKTLGLRFAEKSIALILHHQ